VRFFGVAVGVTMWNVLSISLRQAMIPAELLGRVLGAHRVALWGGIPLGALIGGALAGGTSVSAVFLVSGLSQLVVVALIHRVIEGNRWLIVAYQCGGRGGNMPAPGGLSVGGAGYGWG
jgi:hypothetical protein